MSTSEPFPLSLCSPSVRIFFLRQLRGPPFFFIRRRFFSSDFPPFFFGLLSTGFFFFLWKRSAGSVVDFFFFLPPTSFPLPSPFCPKFSPFFLLFLGEWPHGSAHLSAFPSTSPPSPLHFLRDALQCRTGVVWPFPAHSVILCNFSGFSFSSLNLFSVPMPFPFLSFPLSLRVRGFSGGAGVWDFFPSPFPPYSSGPFR